MLVAGIDPSLRSFGMARLDLDLNTLKLTVLDLKLIETDKQSSKTVRQNSDDLRRAIQLNEGFHEFIADCKFVFAEIPTGAQSARAMYAFGLVVGVISSLKIVKKPLIQVQPFETKLATVGTKTASKEEMIEWADEAYPDAPWMRVKKTNKMLGKNEHLADAVAVAHAGLKTDQFLQIMEMVAAKRAA